MSTTSPIGWVVLGDDEPIFAREIDALRHTIAAIGAGSWRVYTVEPLFDGDCMDDVRERADDERERRNAAVADRSRTLAAAEAEDVA